MARPKPQVGETSLVVGKNCKRLRESLELTLAQLGERLAGVGHPMSTASLSELERGVRKVTVDDLTALAAALGVSPVGLLMPPSLLENVEEVSVTGARGVVATQMLDWLLAAEPYDANRVADPYEVETFRRMSLPPWAWGSGR
ncbi:MAG: helix-turn-helix transcriptional regulator [Mycobacterium sp.]|nr:helix-turn-helix transcriptional regulator [Mycobacterium sp.]